MLSDRCLSVLSCLSVCDVGALWPNGWMDQDETWHAGRPQPWPHCVTWDPAPLPQRGTGPQFSGHICSGQMAEWIKMPPGTKVGFSPGNIVLHGDPASPHKRHSPLIFGPFLLWSNSRCRPSQLLLSTCTIPHAIVLQIAKCFK